MDEALRWSVVLFSVLLTPVRTKTLFFNRLWDGLGVLSYSIYVTHYPLLGLGVEFIHGSTFGTYASVGTRRPSRRSSHFPSSACCFRH